MSKKSNEELSYFGKRLAKLRKAAGYTQQQLADEIRNWPTDKERPISVAKLA